MPQSRPHAKIVTTLNDLLECHFDDDPDVQVLFDMKIFWGLPGLPNPSPDIAVVRDARQDEGRSTFNVAEEGVRPCLILEVVSYSDAEMYRNDHEKKVELYQRVGIPEYLVVDPSFAAEDPLLLTGYRLASDGRYRRIEPDSQGRLHSETTNLFFAPSQDGRTVRVGDARTGEWLLTAQEEKAARIRESKARKAAEERARGRGRARPPPRRVGAAQEACGVVGSGVSVDSPGAPSLSPKLPGVFPFLRRRGPNRSGDRPNRRDRCPNRLGARPIGPVSSPIRRDAPPSA